MKCRLCGHEAGDWLPDAQVYVQSIEDNGLCDSCERGRLASDTTEGST